MAAPVTETIWNTGRLYSAEGQIIRAKVQSDGSILFADISRSIDGRIAKPTVPVTQEGMLQRLVDSKYLHNDYKSDADSWEFHQETRRMVRENPSLRFGPRISGRSL